MRLTIARTILVFTLLMWIIVFPLAVLRILGQMPNLYHRWMRAGDVYHKLGQAITIAVMQHIPNEGWSPWINRHPIVIHNLINRAVSQPTFEKQMPVYLACWTEWWLGIEQQPCLIAHELKGAIDKAQAERIRAYLWETLPSCTEASPPACLPLEFTDYAAYGQLQSAWWEDYKVELIQWIEQSEVESVSVLPDPPPRTRVLNWTILILLCFTALTLMLTDSHKRTIFLSVLFLVLGGSALVMGAPLALGLVHYKTVGLWIGIKSFDVIDILMPQIWPALAHLVGMTLIFIGGLISVPGLCGLSMITHRRILRSFLLGDAVVLLVCAIILFPETAFVQASTLTFEEPQSTPTPWPTFTLTPTHTPTLTPTALPLSEGTPLPPPGGVWWQAPEILRCTTLDGNPIDAVKVYKDTLWVIQSGKYHRYTFAENNLLSESRLPRPYDRLILSPSGQFVALSEGRDVWLYALPDWVPVIRSRISTLNSVTSILFTPDESLAVLGLESGQLWISDVRTGELVTLISAQKSAVTALAPHSLDGLIYAGAADGVVQIWDFRNGLMVKTFSGYTEAIQTIVPLQTALEFISLDDANRFILWDETSGQMLHERTVAVFPTSNLVLVNGRAGDVLLGDGGGFLVGGTMEGQVFILDRNFTYQTLMTFDSPVHALDIVDDYLIVGLDHGQFCIVGNPQ